MTLCNPVDCGQLGSSVHGMLQATTPDWVAVSFCRGSSRPRDRTCIRRRIPDHWGANWTSIRKNSKTRQWSPGRKSFPKSICQEEGTFCWAGLRSYLPRMLKKLVARLKSGLSWWSRAKELAVNAGDSGLTPGLGRPHVPWSHLREKRTPCTGGGAPMPRNQKKPGGSYVDRTQSPPQSRNHDEIRYFICSQDPHVAYGL